MVVAREPADLLPNAGGDVPNAGDVVAGHSRTWPETVSEIESSDSARVRSSRRRQRGDRPTFLFVVTALIYTFLFAPILVVVVFSFNSRRSLSAMGGLSLKWYSQLLQDDGIRDSLMASLQIAVVVMIVAAVLGTLMALGLRSATSRLARGSETLLLLTLVVPEIATAVAAFLLFTQLGITLSIGTVMVAQVTFCIVFVALIVRSRLTGLSTDLEEAAMDLGCTRFQALRLIVVPQLYPAIVAACLLVFVLSFDNFVTSYFTSGLGASPLPVRIYGMLKMGVSPVINAVGTFMMCVSVLLALLAALILRRGKAERAAGAARRNRG